MTISHEAQEQNALAFTDRLNSLTRNIKWSVECQVERWDMQFRCQGTTMINGADFETTITIPVNDNRIEMLPYFVVDYVTRRIGEQYRVEDFGEQWSKDHERGKE